MKYSKICILTVTKRILRRGFSNYGAYSLSKLAVMLFTAELAARVGAGPPTVNTLDPGTVNTKMLYAGWGPCGIDIKVRAIPCAS